MQKWGFVYLGHTKVGICVCVVLRLGYASFAIVYVWYWGWDPKRMRATMGGNLIIINYPDDVGVPTANLLLIKIFLNSVISTKGAKFANADLANFYLMSPLKRPEYAKIKLSDIPEEVIKEYNLHQLATPDGWVYVKVTRAMYGLPQAGSLGQDQLEKRLNQEGYYQSQTVPGLWKHKTKTIQFVLVVDDFGIKYISKDDLDHLISTLEKYYEVSVDLDGKEFVKVELENDYDHNFNIWDVPVEEMES